MILGEIRVKRADLFDLIYEEFESPIETEVWDDCWVIIETIGGETSLFIFPKTISILDAEDFYAMVGINLDEGLESIIFDILDGEYIDFKILYDAGRFS